MRKPGKPLKRKKAIRKVSGKMAVLKKQYMAQRAVYLRANCWCAIWLMEHGVKFVHGGNYDVSELTAPDGSMCPPATEVHHCKRRGPYLLDESTWLPVSRHWHRWVHDNPKEAREKGYLV